MNNYNFSTLNDKEFEQISKDLLNAKFKLDLQSFKAGRDRGVDLRFSTVKNNNSIVVQVKHFVGSAFAQLKHTIKATELDKVKNLKPDRYIVVTSLSLSALEKDELKNILSPFVLTSNDIIDQADLNTYLAENKEIEKRYFKLWFSSINVFNAVLNNAIEGRTRYLLEKINKKIPFYVITQNLDDANKILQKEKILIITGQPGVGKTTLAEILLFERAKNGHKIYTVVNISEAEVIISSNNDEKQLFYFDDFLGESYSEIMNANKTETQLTSFVERVKNTPNKYLILTTRTVILNYAVEKYEKISHLHLSIEQFEIKIIDYNKYEKALILYNHLYFNEVREDLYESIIFEKFYKKIIEHKNYTPRMIEFITNNLIIKGFSSTEYLQFIIYNLDNPEKIWLHSFNNQIDYSDRCFLLTLFTFERGTVESVLVKAFESRLNYEKNAHNQIIYSNQFNKSAKVLLNGFITCHLHNTKKISRQFSFINPSVTDFLIGYTNESFQERKSIISSLIYIEQLNRFNPEKSLIPLENELQEIIRDRILESKISILESNSKYFTKNKSHAILLMTLCKYCNNVNIDSLLLENFKQLDFSGSLIGILSNIEYFLLNLVNSPKTFSHIKENFIKIIEKFMQSISDFDSAKEIPRLFEIYEHNYDDYIELEEYSQNIMSVIESVLQNKESDIKSSIEDVVHDIDDVSHHYNDIYDMESSLLSILFPNTYFVGLSFGIELDNEYWENKIKENIYQLEKNSLNYSDNTSNYHNEVKDKDEDTMIDELFIKQP